LAFIDAIKALQERSHSRQVYARVEQQTTFDGLMQREINFIQERDSFYLASIAENGFPYIQHRGSLQE
jgi:hypothetical protein